MNIATTKVRSEEDSVLNYLYNEKDWEWPYLRDKCHRLGLEAFYQIYAQRIRMSQLSIFLFIMFVIFVIHIILLLSYVMDKNTVYLDIIIYFVSIIIAYCILAANYNTELIEKRPSVQYVTSWFSIITIVASDIGVTVYHAVYNNNPLRPAYESFMIFCIYLFLPIPNDMHALLLGFVTTVAYMTDYIYVTYTMNNREYFDWQQVLSEAIFLIGANCVGLFARLTQEITKRITFLDRRQCVEETLFLRYARDQEKGLLLSMIPARIVKKLEDDIKLKMEGQKSLTKDEGFYDRSTTVFGKQHMNLFIEPHNNVSILYADLVNYTHLTTTLDVRTLVETLHDLFMRFDNASQRLDVLRIKFLGDCYCCVSGVPVANENHAKACVELGLQMIKDIRDVRETRKLNIDMRIGVHSGNILSGVIGVYKWQYDIWSKDVDIASRLEATGVAGRVHVSEQTLRLLDAEFLYEESTEKAQNDHILRKHQIRSFLIVPRPEPSPDELNLQRSSFHLFEEVETLRSEHKTVNFIQNTVIDYDQIRTQAKMEMRLEMEKMPISRLQLDRYLGSRSRRFTREEMEEQTFRNNITLVLLFFKDRRWEYLYMHEPDILLKYSLIFGLAIYFSIIIQQAVNAAQNWIFWLLVLLNTTLICFFIAACWFRKIWIIKNKTKEKPVPTKKFSKILFKVSEIIKTNVGVRCCAFGLLIFAQLIAALLQMNDCDRLQTENEQIEEQLFTDGEYPYLCFNPWAITDSMMLIASTVYVFPRIPFILKIVTDFIIFTVYMLLVTFQFDYIYERSVGTNEGLIAEYSHIMCVVVIQVICHIFDQQTEFISRVDYMWKRQLQNRRNDARITNETILILIHNILPIHVADIYMTKQIRNELYYEEYENVAVIFATVTKFDTEKVGLRVLNEIICDFDEVLTLYKGPLKIEKIKVANWTYMAACGLDITRRSDGSKIKNYAPIAELPESSSSHYTTAPENSYYELKRETRVDSFEIADSSFSLETPEEEEEGELYQRLSAEALRASQKNSVVYVITQFALDLMRAMRAFNEANLNVENHSEEEGVLRIGISHGEVMAGVVGSYKPHYDIWGNAVNMASRMESTGRPNTIQVTQNTADVLKSFGLLCYSRGLTEVKGTGLIPTYFVGINRNLDFKRATVSAGLRPNKDGLLSD